MKPKGQPSIKTTGTIDILPTVMSPTLTPQKREIHRARTGAIGLLLPWKLFEATPLQDVNTERSAE